MLQHKVSIPQVLLFSNNTLPYCGELLDLRTYPLCSHRQGPAAQLLPELSEVVLELYQTVLRRYN